MKTFILFFGIFLFITFHSYAQTGRQVQGTLQDSTGVTIPGALVKLVSATDSINTSTNENGVFSFGRVKARQFSLTFKSIGYEGLKRKYTLDEDAKPANVGKIILHTESKMLNTVNITDINAIKVKEDTTEYKASAYPVRANAPVEDVLKKLPGVDVDKDGNVTAEGKAVNKVRVNGKDFFGGDVKTATKNLPADMIESIQMIDDYGDQANLTGIKTGEPNKIMNIVIRKDKNYGYSASTTGGDGGDAVPAPSTIANRYVGSINSFKFKGDQQIALLGSINNTNVNTFSFGGNNGGGGGGGGRRGGGTTTPANGITLAKSLGLNFRDQWGKDLSVYGSYSFADNTTNTISKSTQTNITGSPVQIFNPSSSNQQTENLNHRLNWNMEYKPDTVNYFKVVPSYAYSSNNGIATTSNTLIRNNVTNSSYQSNTTSNSNSPNYGISVLYNHRFKAQGRNFSINTDANSSPSNSYQNPVYIYFAGKPNAPLDQRINTNARTNSVGVNLSYIEPLGKKTSLEANYSYNTAYTTTNKETDTIAYLNNTAYNPPVINRYDLLSNNYNYTFTTNRFGLNYRLIDKKYNLTLGLGVEPSVLDGYSPTSGQSTHVTSFNYIPTLRYVYNFTRSQTFSANYNGYSNQPSFNQLQPVTDFSNATYPIQGNPNLNPEFNNNFSVRYSKFSFGTGDFILTNLSFTQTDNKISANTISYPRRYTPNPKLSNSIFTTYGNTDGYYSANGFFAYSKPWQKRKYTLMFNGGFSYTNNISLLSNVDSLTFATTTQKNTAKTLSISPGMRFRLDITDVVDVQLSTSYSINKTDNSIAQGAQNSNYKTLNLGLNGKNYFWTNWTVSYDYTKTIYQGFVGSTNPNILNGYIERRFLKNNMATIRASAFDVFNENTGFSNNSTAYSTTSTQSNRLGRYYLLTLTVRLQKFAGKSPQQDNGPGGGRRFEGGRGGDGGGRGPGGF